LIVVTYVDVVALALLFGGFADFATRAEHEVAMLVCVEVFHPDRQWWHFISKPNLKVELVISKHFKLLRRSFIDLSVQSLIRDHNP